MSKITQGNVATVTEHAIFLPMTNSPQRLTGDNTILDEIKDFLRRFIVFQDPNQYDVLALWIIHTHSFSKVSPYATPYIYVKSAEKQSGKTRVIEVASLLAHNPAATANTTGAALFRKIEQQRPTIFIDEVDAIFTGAANEELRGMLNSGYQHKGSVDRVVPGSDGGEVRAFSTFCPKLLAGIDNGAIPDTIADRCIIFDLKRKKSGEEVERLRNRVVEPEADELKAQIQEWVNTHAEKIAAAQPKVIEEISDRAFDIAEPLLQIAMQIKGEGPKARKALTEMLAAKTPALSLQAQALATARNLFTEGDRDRITSAELAAAMEISAKRLGVLLAPYGITPTTIRFTGGIVQKGYHRRDFVDAWERYLND